MKQIFHLRGCWELLFAIFLVTPPQFYVWMYCNVQRAQIWPQVKFFEDKFLIYWSWTVWYLSVYLSATYFFLAAAAPMWPPTLLLIGSFVHLHLNVTGKAFLALFLCKDILNGFDQIFCGFIAKQVPTYPMGSSLNHVDHFLAIFDPPPPCGLMWTFEWPP